MCRKEEDYAAWERLLLVVFFVAGTSTFIMLLLYACSTLFAPGGITP